MAEAICEPGITQKFLQNDNLLQCPDAKYQFNTTKGKTLVESSFDDIWGTGVHIASKDALIKSKWRGEGLLGKILMNIRNQQTECIPPTEDVATDAVMNAT